MLSLNCDIEKVSVTLPQMEKVSAFLIKMQFYTFIKNIDKILASFSSKEEPVIGENLSLFAQPVSPAGDSVQQNLFSQAIKETIQDTKILEDKMNVTQGKLVLGMQINKMQQDERFVAMVYNTILGDSANSKMFQNVREKAHLAYSARSTYIKPKNDIFIRCGIEIENYEKALNIIKKQIEDMKNGNFTDEDIDNAKKYIISAVTGVEEEQDTEITYYLGQELAGTRCTLEQYKESIMQVTKQQIQDIANQMQIHTIYFLRN